ncbi:MAG TPA: dihydroneopterin aldolase [Flavisolibacter sp.]
MTIQLKGLRLFANHGLYAEESKAGNEFGLDISLCYPVQVPAISEIDQTVNYVDAYAIVTTIFQKREDLLETVAMKMMDELYRVFPFLSAASISINKLTPPIPNFIGSLGVTYSKTF